MSTPILPLAVWASGTNQNSIPANDNALRIEALSREIISLAVTAQPGSPTDGDTYIIAATHTGAQWAGFSPKDIAIYRGGTWYAWAPTEGVVVNVAGALYKYDGAVWVAATTSGMSNPMTTAQDIITGGSSGTPARLAVGSNGQVLSVAAGAVGWATPSAGFANPMTTAEDIIKGGASGAAARLAAGSNGQVLTVTAGAVSWATPSAGFVNPMTTAEDLIKGGASGAAARLAVGSNGQVLTVTAGAAGWATPSAGFANPMTTTGDVIYSSSGSTPDRLGVGSSGQVLTVAAGVPSWATPSSGFVNPMTTIGDVIVGSTAGAAIRLANGTAGYVLTAQSGAPPAWVVSGTFTGGTLTGALNEAPQVTIASAATVNIGAAAANTVVVSGTTTITAFDTIAAGAIRRVRFSGILTLTHNATTLILPTSASIGTAAGDVATMESLGSGNWRCIGYARQDGTAVGGSSGGLTNFTDSLQSASPNNTTNAARLIVTTGTADVDLVLSPKAAGAIQAHLADSSTPGGNKRGTYATDWQRSRSNATYVASGNYSVIAGGVDNRASGLYSVSGGGDSNAATATRAAVLSGGSNSATGAAAVIAGGTSNTAAGLNASIAGGTGNTASGDYSMCWGYANTSSGLNSTAFGRSATTRGLGGAMAQANGRFASDGDSQTSTFVHRITTTNATPAALSSDAAAPAAGTAIVLPNNSVYCFEANVVGKLSTFGDRGSFKIIGQVARGANAAATVIDGSVTVTTIATVGGASAWSVTAVANTTLGSLAIQVTGVAATTINWVGNIRTTEIVG